MFNEKIEALDKSIKTIYKSTSDKYQDALRGKVYDVTKVTGAATNIVSIGSVPSMQEWKSERRPGQALGTVSTVVPRKYEATLEVSREKVEDDDYGFVAKAVSKMTTQAKKHYASMASAAYVQGFTAELNDGKAFFHTDRGNLQTGALTADNFNAARHKLASQKDASGNSLQYMAKILLVGPANEAAAEQIVKAQTIEGTSNINYNRCEVMVSAAISGMEWFVIDNSEGYLPVTIAERLAATLESHQDPKSDNVFTRDIFAWGLRGRYDPAYVDPQLVVGSNGLDA